MIYSQERAGYAEEDEAVVVIVTKCCGGVLKYNMNESNTCCTITMHTICGNQNLDDSP